MDIASHLSPPDAFRAAVAVAGSMSALARKIGTSQQRLSYRLRRQLDCPPELALPIERETGISKHLLRPDVYGESLADLAAVADTADAVASNTAAVFDRRSA